MASIKNVVEFNYIDPLFEDQSRLSYEMWRDRSTFIYSIYMVWYEPQNLRMLIFKKNQVEVAKKEMRAFDSFAS